MIWKTPDLVSPTPLGAAGCIYIFSSCLAELMSTLPGRESIEALILKGMSVESKKKKLLGLSNSTDLIVGLVKLLRWKGNDIRSV